MRRSDKSDLAELIDQSLIALDWISNLPEQYRENPTVCWSVGWRDRNGDIVEDAIFRSIETAASRDLKLLYAPSEYAPLEAPIDLHGLGGEIIERSMPTLGWLNDRLEVLPEILERHGLRIDGWAFEPTNSNGYYENWIPQAWCYQEADF